MARLNTLVVCEKPSAAARVAQAIDDERIPRKLKQQGVPYFECGTRQGKVTVCSAIGHLYSVGPKGRSNSRLFPIWDNRWRPKNEQKHAEAKFSRWISTIKTLARTADHFVNACDYDTEGSLIGYMILKYACNASESQSSRMTFSTMTEGELRRAFRKSVSGLGDAEVESGRCRHELDWLYGINLSRVLTNSMLQYGAGYATLSTGRVQGPTLKFVVDREEEIGYFLPIPYWVIDAEIEYHDQRYRVDYQRGKIENYQEASHVVEDCHNRTLSVREIASDYVEQKPPYPFDLSGLQSEAFRHFGYSPSRTLAVAEELYLNALISYPRTGSQKLPPSIGYASILRDLTSQADYRHHALKILERGYLYPVQGFKQDQAHPAIYPTGQTPRFKSNDPKKQLYDLIVKRFLTAFAQAAVYLTQTATLEIGRHTFSLIGKTIEQHGWIESYRPYVSLETRALPSFEVGDKIAMGSIDARECFTQPPSRFSSLSLLRKMEEEGIGTKATRAGIIEILYLRDYVDRTKLSATPLAMTVISLLEEYCHRIIDAKLTEAVENSMSRVLVGETSRKLVLVDTVRHLRAVMMSLIEHQEELGSLLGTTLSAQRQAVVSLKTPCPNCGSTLTIVRNRNTGKRFVGCKGRWETGCKFTLPLPQMGSLTLIGRFCKECGFQLVQVRYGRRRASASCPRCYATSLGKKSSGVDDSESPGKTQAAEPTLST
jgi:DNA topoisomerase I